MTDCSTLDRSLSFSPLAESALLVRVGGGAEINPWIVDEVIALTSVLDHAKLRGVTDIVPAYSTILIEFDPCLVDGETVEAQIRAVAGGPRGAAVDDSRVVIIPVLYGGVEGPDLAEVASIVNLSEREVVELHAAGEYRVACMGFSPGWAYLIGLDPALTVPRLDAPRTRVPPGSVSLGGGQTGVYPLETPGGWRLIGRTPLRMFDPDRSEPFLLKPGDKVRFAEIDRVRYDLLEAEVASSNG